MRIAHYAKGITVAVGMTAISVVELLGEVSLGAQDLAVVVLAVATALGVVGVPNEPKHPVDDMNGLME